MNVIVTANIVPFIKGGAEIHISGLVEHLCKAGVNVECVRFPFRFSPLEDISRAMAFCESQDLNQPNGIRVDKVISLQFPAYGVLHDDLRIWVMHQHRAVYELYDQQVNLYLHGELPLEHLYTPGALTFEFKRTMSRLIEMQSVEYLHRQNQP